MESKQKEAASKLDNDEEMVSDNENDAEQANSAQALWTRSSSAIKHEEYVEFFKSNFGAFDDPYLKIHNKTEGSIDFTNLLFILIFC